MSFIGGPERIDELLGAADYLAVTLALTPDTRGLLDETRLQLLRPGCYLINVARGEIIDEAALYRALSAGAIAGAAIDVWYRYPTSPGNTRPSASPFHELSNVIMTPHVSGWTEGMLTARAALIAENIARVSRGEIPFNVVSMADGRSP